jgi:1,2-phenylacetyl-CoA epoxidase catalytic subunit
VVVVKVHHTNSMPHQAYQTLVAVVVVEADNLVILTEPMVAAE